MGNCSTARQRRVDLPMELTYVSDGGGPMVCLFYEGDPPPDSTGSRLWAVRRDLASQDAARSETGIDIFLWDTSIANASDWRNGLDIFGVTVSCQLPTVVLYAPSRTYRKAVRTLHGPDSTLPDQVLQAMREAWKSDLKDGQWRELLKALVVPSDDPKEVEADRPPDTTLEEKSRTAAAEDAPLAKDAPAADGSSIFDAPNFQGLGCPSHAQLEAAPIGADRSLWPEGPTLMLRPRP